MGQLGEEGVNTVARGFTWEMVAMKGLYLWLLPPLSLRTLAATGPALSLARQVDNSADSLPEQWPEHNAHQPGPPQSDGPYHGPTWFY